MRIASMVGLTLLTTCSAWGQEWVYKADAPAGLATNLIYDTAQGVVKGFGSEASYAWNGVSWTADVREGASFYLYDPCDGSSLRIHFDSIRGKAVAVSEAVLPADGDHAIYELSSNAWQLVQRLPMFISATWGFDSSRGVLVFGEYDFFTWDGYEVGSPFITRTWYGRLRCAFDASRNVFVGMGSCDSGGTREVDFATGFSREIPVPSMDASLCWSAAAQAVVFIGKKQDSGSITTWTWDGTRLLERLVGFPGDYQTGDLVFDESRGVLVLVSSGKTYELASLPPAPAIISFTPALRNLRRGSTARLDVTTSNDADLAKVEIWRDVNSNNELDLGVDFKLGDTTRGANNRWTASLPTRTWPAGQQQLLAVAYEEFTNATSFLATPMTIVNSIPMLPGFTATPRRIATPLTPMTVTALRPTDVDGTVTRIDYFIDYDRSGARGANEPLFSTTNLTARLNVPTELLAYGFNQIVAHAIDNDGARSLPVRQRVYVNRPPVTTAFSATPSTISGTTATFTLSVTGTDVDGSITGAEFWWDVNNNGIIDSTVDRKIGTPRRVGTTNTWTSTQPRGTILTGQQRFIGRLIDNERVNSAPTSPVTVTFN